MAEVADNAILDEAFKLARMGRAFPKTLQRSEQGGFLYYDCQNREAWLQAVLDLYDSKWVSFIDPMPGESYSEAMQRPGRFNINHLRQFISAWSATYTEDPVRVFYKNGTRLEADDPFVKALQDMYRDGCVNEAMNEVDGLLRLVGNAVLRPLYDEASSELVVHNYASPNVRVVENPRNPARPFATVLLGYTVKRNSEGASRKTEVAEVWTESGYWLLSGGGVTEAVPLDDKPPLVHCFDARPTNETGYFVECPGPDLAQITNILNNDFYGQLGYTTLMQGFGVTQVFGHDGKELKIGPGRAIAFSGDQTLRQGVEFATSNAPLQDWVAIINAIVDKVQQVYGIPKSMLEVQTDASGAAIVRANAPLSEIRKARQKTFRKIETDFLRAMLRETRGRVDGIQGSINPDDYDVSVRYIEPDLALSTQDRINKDKHMLELGVLTPAQILMRERPDEFDTLEQAEEYLNEQTQTEAPPEAEGVLEEGNPYRIEKDGNEFIVVKISDGKVMGRHPTRDKATAQFRALEAAAHSE